MDTNAQTIFSRARAAGFTLIELLVVIAIIAVLAGLTMVVIPGITRTSQTAKIKAQMVQIEAAIESYHGKYGFYPPSPPPPPSGQRAQTNDTSLFYELSGVVRLPSGAINDFEGAAAPMPPPGVGGYVNQVNVPDPVLNFMGKQPRYVQTSAGVKYLRVAVDLPASRAPIIPGLEPGANVWCYNSSNPSHNKKTFDLWAQIAFPGKESQPRADIIIGNWKP